MLFKEDEHKLKTFKLVPFRGELKWLFMGPYPNLIYQPLIFAVSIVAKF